jgi:hypothetical protein
MDVQNILARNVFVHKSPVAVLRRQRWECSTVVAVLHWWWLCDSGGCSGVVCGESGMRGQTHKECVCL